MARRLQWAGHVARVPLTWRIRQVLDGRSTSPRSLQGLPLYWEDNVSMDLDHLGIPGWPAACRAFRRGVCDVVTMLRTLQNCVCVCGEGIL